MPTIACPGCGKQYKLPASAAGQVAKCACGKKFKVGGAAASTSVAKPAVAAKPAGATAKADGAPKPVMTTKAKVVAAPSARSTASPAPATDDDFWEEGLKEPVKKAPPEPAPTPVSAAAAASRPKNTSSGSASKKKKKKSGGIKWGFDWGKVVAGMAAFLFFGGLTVAIVMSTGRISRGTVYLAVPAIGGLFTAINGLMGEEGIW